MLTIVFGLILFDYSAFSLQAHELLVILLQSALLLHDLQLIPYFVLRRAHNALILVVPRLIPLIHGPVEGLHLVGRLIEMVDRSRHVLVDKGIIGSQGVGYVRM